MKPAEFFNEASERLYAIEDMCDEAQVYAEQVLEDPVSAVEANVNDLIAYLVHAREHVYALLRDIEKEN